MNFIQHRAKHQLPLSFSLGQLAKETHSRCEGDPNIPITGLGTLANAKAGEISFLAEEKYRAYLKSTQASAVILSEKEVSHCPVPALVAQNPKLVFAQVAELLYPNKKVAAVHHPLAVIGESSVIHPNTAIGPFCVIGERVKIAENVIIEAGCTIGDDCEIGPGTVLYAQVRIYAGCRIGEDCTIHSGVVIGSDGFGFAKHQDRWHKVPQIGGVRIGDRVEVGANTTIDRGAIEDTIIGNDVILDNQIQIGHNVKIGDSTAMAACSGVAGSAVIGKHCMIGGRTGIVGHIEITDHVSIVGSSNVGQSIKSSGAYASGLTTTDMRTWKRNLVRFHQLDALALRLIELERKIKAQEEI